MKLTDEMMKDVKWTAKAGNCPDADIPYATHTGKLNLLGMELDVARLSTGQTVITEDSLGRFFDAFFENKL